MSERGSWRGEIIHVTRDGRELHVKSSVTSLHHSHAAQRRIIAVVRDVTDCKANEAAHRENVVLFSRLIEQAPMGTFVIDSAFRLQQMFWNLLNNAAKFTPTRGRIEIASAESDLNRVAPLRALHGNLAAMRSHDLFENLLRGVFHRPLGVLGRILHCVLRVLRRIAHLLTRPPVERVVDIIFYFFGSRLRFLASDQREYRSGENSMDEFHNWFTDIARLHQDGCNQFPKAPFTPDGAHGVRWQA